MMLDNIQSHCAWLALPYYHEAHLLCFRDRRISIYLKQSALPWCSCISVLQHCWLVDFLEVSLHSSRSSTSCHCKNEDFLKHLPC